MIGTAGGFGGVLSLLGFTQIRAYERISVLIALLSFAVIALVFDWMIERQSTHRGRIVVSLVLLLVSALAILDQTSPLAAPRYAAVAAEYRQDDSLGAEIQTRLPTGSTVFQLPYVPFPEGAVHGVGYEQFKPYLHTTGLRWSYGSFAGRPTATWQNATAALPPAQLVSALRAAHFSAIYVDRNGYGSEGAELLARLTEILGKPIVQSSDGRYFVFRL